MLVSDLLAQVRARPAPRHRSPCELPAPLGAASVGVALIVGPPRSGTTLVSRLLSSVPRACSLSEPFLARSVLPDWRFQRLLYQFQRENRLARRRAPHNVTDQRYLTFLREMAAENGLSRLLLKETFRGYGDWPTWRNEALLGRLTQAPTVGILRDPVDVAASTLKLCRWVTGWRGRLLRLRWPNTPWFCNEFAVAEWAAHNWVCFVDWARSAAVPLIHYERLTREPQATLIHICQRLRLPALSSPREGAPQTGVFGGIGDPGVMRRPPRSVSAGSVGLGAALPRKIRERVRSIVAARLADCDGV